MQDKLKMNPKFFAKASDFRKWLKANHHKKKELLVGFYKVNSGKPSMGWSESVDQALSFGWIDGVRKSLGKESYMIRFTPRKQGSIWSAINIKKVNHLINEGLMEKPGLDIFQNRDKSRAMVYSHENAPTKLSVSYLKKFKASGKAWEFFNIQAPSYRKIIVFWIMSAKREATQLSRLEKAINASKKQKRL